MTDEKGPGVNSLLNMRRDQKLHSKALILFICVWAITLIGGVSLLAWYSSKPGDTGSPPREINRELRDSSRDKQHQLIMFIHPKCSCTRSSLRELTKILESSPSQIFCTFYCFTPSDKSIRWTQTDLTETAQSISESKTIFDVDGKWAETFDVKTSGHVLLYDPKGKLQFSGGITVGRGHEGESIARTFITKAVKNKVNHEYRSPVFGCPIIRH